MLFKAPDVIFPKTLKVLQSIQNDEKLNDFFLVGGTALALQIGHRLSVDLDLFTLTPFDTRIISDHLYQRFEFQINSLAENTILGEIEGVKVDFITHAYPLVRELQKIEGLRLASLEDISAMKLNAIAHSGQRIKDFIDIYVLLERFPLELMLDAYASKYPKSNTMIPLKGLTYFEDVDPEEDTPTLNREIEFSAIKSRLLNAVENPDKIFSRS